MINQYKSGVRVTEELGRLTVRNERMSRVSVEIDGVTSVLAPGQDVTVQCPEGSYSVTVTGEREGPRGARPGMSGPFEPDAQNVTRFDF